MNVTAPAERDLEAIHSWIASDSPESADAFIRKLTVALHKLARTGNRGVPRDTLRPGLRAHVYGNYVIYFRLTDEATVILRIVNSARDPARLTFDENGDP